MIPGFFGWITKKPSPESSVKQVMNDSGEIRTHDRPLRRRMLYPAELPNHRNVIYYTTWKRKMSNKIYEKIVKTFLLLKEHVNSS